MRLTVQFYPYKSQPRFLPKLLCSYKETKPSPDKRLHLSAYLSPYPRPLTGLQEFLLFSDYDNDFTTNISLFRTAVECEKLFCELVELFSLCPSLPL